VLCYLEGKTNEQAAQVLGCPQGSMSARLAQARERLRAGLAQRGHAVPAAGIATLLASAGAEAGVPSRLLSDSVRTALWFSSEQAGIAGVVSTRAVALAKGAFRAVFGKPRSPPPCWWRLRCWDQQHDAAERAASQASPPTGSGATLDAAGSCRGPRRRLPSVLARMGSTPEAWRRNLIGNTHARRPGLLTAGRDKTVLVGPRPGKEPAVSIG
jgi:hypothetical protein